MIDINLIREQPDWVEDQIAKLHTEAPVDQIVSLDRRRRQLLQQVEDLKHLRNVGSKEVSRTKDHEARQTKIAEMKAVSDKIKILDEKVRKVEQGLRESLLWMPNMPHGSVPVGSGEEENQIVRQEGAPKEFSFKPVPHWDLGPRLGIIDFERGAKLSGTRFYLLKGKGSQLQRALIQWMLDLHVEKHDYLEVYPPFMVRRDMMVGAAQLPKFADNIYHDAEDDFWWIGTAEIALTNIHRDEILPLEALPIKYVAYTACFRREKMSAGRDVRGIKRGHQFDKVEMYRFTTPESSYTELEAMVEEAADICRALEIPFRVIEMCTADLGFQAAKKYDLEMWAPGCGEWLEVSSVSNCTTFQARRANVRFRRNRGAKPEFVHTLNGSGLALPRVMIAILESYQQEDGTIVIPQVLRSYMGGASLID